MLVPWKAQQLGENKVAEEKVDVEYISLHRYIRNTPSDTEVHAEHQLRVNRSTCLTSAKEYVEPHKTQ